MRPDLHPRVRVGLEQQRHRVERHIGRRQQPRGARVKGHTRNHSGGQSSLGRLRGRGRLRHGHVRARHRPAHRVRLQPRWRPSGAGAGHRGLTGCAEGLGCVRSVPSGLSRGCRTARRLTRHAPGRVDGRASRRPGQRSRPSSTPSPSSSPGHPSASTVAPRGVSEQRSRPSGILSPSLSLGQPCGSTRTPAGVSGQRSSPSAMLSPSLSWEQPRSSTAAPGHRGGAAVHAVGHAVAVAVARAAPAVDAGPGRRVGALSRLSRTPSPSLSGMGLLPSIRLTPRLPPKFDRDWPGTPVAFLALVTVVETLGPDQHGGREADTEARPAQERAAAAADRRPGLPRCPGSCSRTWSCRRRP